MTDGELRFAAACRQIAFLTGTSVALVQRTVLAAYERERLILRNLILADWAERCRDKAMWRRD